jgi:ribosomal protein S18 acetylase RimI-like enzyme
MGTTAFQVSTVDDPGDALAAIGPFLASRPVDHNVIATVLADCLPYPGIGRCWWASGRHGVEAAAIQIPRGNKAAITPGPVAAIDALVEAMAEDSPGLPGVVGEAAPVSRFAGRWAEQCRVPAAPVEGGRLYRLGMLVAPPTMPGLLRQGTAGDEDTVIDWAAQFQAETGDGGDTVANVRHRLAAGHLWVWEDGDSVAMASAPGAVFGVARVGLVFTRPDCRRRGYAAAVVAALSEHLLGGQADTCILYTQLSNPTSNAVYQRLGYRAVTETVTYQFARPDG